jgi:hypothetical protein
VHVFKERMKGSPTQPKYEGGRLGWLSLRNAESLPGPFYNVLRGASILLVGGGPSVSGIDWRMVEASGIPTLAINNVWSLFRPHYWVSNDAPSKFMFHRWKDPTVVKFVWERFFRAPLAEKMDDGRFRHAGVSVRDMPNVWGFRRTNHFDTGTFFRVDAVSWGNTLSTGVDDVGVVNKRSTLLSAVRLARYLGAGRAYLVGVDLSLPVRGEPFYGFGETKVMDSYEGVKGQYEGLRKRLLSLERWCQSHGEPFSLWNTVRGNGLDELPFRTLDHVLEMYKYRGSVDPQGWYENGPRVTKVAKVGKIVKVAP